MENEQQWCICTWSMNVEWVQMYRFIINFTGVQCIFVTNVWITHPLTLEQIKHHHSLCEDLCQQARTVQESYETNSSEKEKRLFGKVWLISGKVVSLPWSSVIPTGLKIKFIQLVTLTDILLCGRVLSAHIRPSLLRWEKKKHKFI